MTAPPRVVVEPSEHRGHPPILVGWIELHVELAGRNVVTRLYRAKCERCGRVVADEPQTAAAESQLRSHRRQCRPPLRIRPGRRGPGMVPGAATQPADDRTGRAGSPGDVAPAPVPGATTQPADDRPEGGITGQRSPRRSGSDQGSPPRRPQAPGCTRCSVLPSRHSRTTFTEVTYQEAVAAARKHVGPKLKRAGAQNGEPRYTGPCPICGGDDRFRVAQGDLVVLVQCSQGCTYADLLAALGLTDRDGPAPAPRAVPTAARAPSRNPWLTDVWEATLSANDTPGESYLVEHRSVWLSGRPFPASVRWLPAPAAVELGLRRDDWPAPAAGCLVYKLAAPGESETWALKVEAIGDDGNALRFEKGGKRPSLFGSLTDTGRRTFHAGGDRDRGIHLVEGPIDALALVTLYTIDEFDLRSGAVLGADGTGGFTERACSGSRGRVTLYPDGARWNKQKQRWAPEAEAKAIRLAQVLERAGRGFVHIVRQPRGQDLADLADSYHEAIRSVDEDTLERIAIQQEST